MLQQSLCACAGKFTFYVYILNKLARFSIRTVRSLYNLLLNLFFYRLSGTDTEVLTVSNTCSAGVLDTAPSERLLHSLIHVRALELHHQGSLNQTCSEFQRKFSGTTLSLPLILNLRVAIFRSKRFKTHLLLVLFGLS